MVTHLLIWIESISTITLTVPVLDVNQITNLDAWLRSVLWNSVLPGTHSEESDKKPSLNFEIHRLKARIPLSNGDVKIIQGVREIFEILDAPKPNVGNCSFLSSFLSSLTT